jgi:putative membrane protein
LAEGEPDYRFTLANERTLLAWERTAIALVAASLVVFHFLPDGWQEYALGVLLLVAGAIAGIGGYVRYRQVDTAVRADRPLPPNPMAHLLGGTVLACVVAAAVIVLL